LTVVSGCDNISYMELINYIDNEELRQIDYVYDDGNGRKCLRLSEDNDYFGILLFSSEDDLSNKKTVNISQTNALYGPFSNLIMDNNKVEILEEGTEEHKSLVITKAQNGIILEFVAPEQKNNCICISITNVRMASPDVNFGEGSMKIKDFKNKLHYAFDQIIDNIKEVTM